MDIIFVHKFYGFRINKNMFKTIESRMSIEVPVPFTEESKTLTYTLWDILNSEDFYIFEDDKDLSLEDWRTLLNCLWFTNFGRDSEEKYVRIESYLKKRAQSSEMHHLYNCFNNENC